jgi:predicted DNA-binding transcriptional regulator YafY
MSKSKTPSPRQLLRLLDMDELIRSGKRQTIGTLAVATERSERTIRNDLDMPRGAAHQFRLGQAIGAEHFQRCLTPW